MAGSGGVGGLQEGETTLTGLPLYPLGVGGGGGVKGEAVGAAVASVCVGVVAAD